MTSLLRKKRSGLNKLNGYYAKNQIKFRISPDRRRFMKRALSVKKFHRQLSTPIRLKHRKTARNSNEIGGKLTDLEQFKLEINKLITISQEKFREKWNFDPIEMTPVSLGDGNNNTLVKYQWDLVA